ncbi:MAG: YciC family protein [Pontibacterium sp.]
MPAQTTFDYVKQSLFFFRTHWISIAQIIVPFALIESVLSMALLPSEPTPEDILKELPTLLIVNFMLLPVYQAALITYMAAIVRDNYISAFQAIRLGLNHLVPLILVYLLMGLAITAGFMMLLVPGIFLLFTLSYAEFINVLERKNPFKSIEESIRRATPIFFTLFVGKSIIFFGLFILQNAILVMSEVLGLPKTVVDVAGSMLFSLLFSLITIFGFRLYCVDLEENKR